MTNTKCREKWMIGRSYSSYKDQNMRTS
uniref:Uncharacterized protein n=1 Tax=Arundo donax TaxID=35708 RepID=A0A0A9TPH1_ARUDO